MAVNRGKKFELVIRQAFEKVPDVSIDRLHDQTTGYKNSSANICDFIVYKKPMEIYIECKSVHGNTLPFSNITDNQWQGLLEKSKIKGVRAGVICWWVDRNVTRFIPIQMLEVLKTELNAKSIRFDFLHPDVVYIHGKKRRVFFDYDMQSFLKEIGEQS